MDRFSVVRGKRDFTAISNGIFRDRRLSLKAKGLLCVALSLPEDWAFSIRGLASLCKEGKDAVMSALDELEGFGYLRRSRAQAHDARGAFGGTEYVFYEAPEETEVPETEPGKTSCAGFPNTGEPNTGEPNTGEPNTGEPNTGNPPQYKNITIKDETIDPPVSPRGEAGEDKPTRRKYAPDSFAYRCAKYLDDAIRARLPEQRPSGEATLQKWAEAFDKCHRLDGYTVRTIGEALRFSQTDEFWQKNILSGRAFRKQLTRLYAKCAGAVPPSRAAPGAQRVMETKGVREL